MAGDLLVLAGILTLGLLSPGPDFLLIVKNSIGGWQRGAATATGIAAGLVGHVTLVLGGFAALDATGRAEAALVVRWAGAGVLVWLGIAAWRGAGRAPAAAARTGAAAWRGPFLEGLFCNVTNAKALLFFAALFSRVLPPEPPVATVLAFGGLVVAHAWVCWTLLSLALQWPPVQAFLARHQAWILRGFGAGLVLLGASLVLAT